MPQFDYIGAKNAGASDEEIESFLKQSGIDFDLAGAKNAGADDNQIAEFLKNVDQVKKKDVSTTGAGPSASTSLASGSVSGSAGPSKGIGFKPLTAEQQAAAKGVLGTPTVVKEQPKVKPRQPQAEAQVFPTTQELMTQAGARPEAENAAFIPTVTPEDRQVLTDQTPKEQDYFLTREDTKLQEIGNVLQKFDEFTGLGFGDYVDDIARSIDAGYRQGQTIAPALSLMMSGKNATPEQIQEYIDAAKYAEEIGPSTEMQDFRKIYEQEGKGVFGFLKGLANNPSVATEIALSSLVSLANKASAVTAGGVVGASGLVGGTATAEFGGIGAIPAMLAAVPEALAAASTTLETSSSFSEFLNQELKDRGLDFTKENVKSVLEDAKAVSRMRTKAIARGATIGIIDAVTGRLAGAVGANLAGNTAASKIKSQLAAGGLEMGGGALGETAARGVTGQDMDVSEIGFEAAGNLGLGPINVAAETARRATQPATSPVINSARSIYAKAAAKILKKPVYKINGEVRPEVDVEEVINTATPEELNNIKFEFTNDNKGYANIIQDKVVTGQIRNEVKEANPNLSDADVDKITELERQLKKNEGNKTYTGKELNTSIKKQIKDIQENATVNVKPEGEDTFITMRYDEQGNEIKQEENAIQEPSTETGVLRTEQPEVGLPKVGEGNAQEQAIAEEGGQVAPAKKGELDIKSLSIDELEKKLSDLELSKEEKDKQLFNQIDKELEKREWQSILNTPLNEVNNLIDNLMVKEKEMPNGFGAYMDKADAIKSKEVVKKYSEEVSKEEAAKDFKDAFFGNPANSYADALKLKESVRAYGEQGGSFKDLLKNVSQEFTADGFSESDAAKVINRKLKEIQKVNQEESKPAETAAAKEGEVAEPLKDVESTTKALEPKIQGKSSLGVKLRSLVNLITHNGPDAITRLDSSKIQGSSRGRYGKGFYFSELFKNFDYGDKSTYLDTKSLNFMNGDMSVLEALNNLILPSEINSKIYKLDRLLLEAKNVREYDQITKQIEDLKKIQSKFDTNSKYIEKALKDAVKENPNENFGSILESLESRVIRTNGLDRMRAVEGLNDSINNILLESGFDGVKVTDGHEVLVIPQEKLNDLIVPSQENFIAEAYQKAKTDGSNPELVKAVEEAIGKPAETTPAKEEVEMTPDEKEALAQEVKDLEDLLGLPANDVRFRLAEGEQEQVSESDVEKITEEMNKMAPVELNFTVPVDTRGEIVVSPASESNADEKLSPEEAAKITKDIQEFNGIPMIAGMSDILATGTIKDSQGNKLKANGGILFNVLDKFNKALAWAGVTKAGAQEQYNNAVNLYKANKELFDRLWKEKKLPYGQVPMAIMRMANSALHSNEVVFRWLLPTIEKLPKANRKNALDVFVNSMERQLNTEKADSAQYIIDFIKNNKITTLDGLIKEIIKDAELRTKGDPKSKLALDDRSFIYDSIFAKSGTKTASKPTVKALLEGTGKEYNNQFLSDTVYKELGEPSMLKTSQGDVVSIVGIDVLNGGVTEAKHGNYGFGPKGGIIALIRNPKHGIDVFPEWNAKTARIFKPDKDAVYPKTEAVAQQTGGIYFMDKAFRGAKPMVGKMSDLDVLIGKLRFAFPSVQVARSSEEFNDIIKREDVRKRITKGKTVLGVTVDGKIYLNPDYKSLNTPIHEFGHIWIDFLRSEASGRKGTKLLEKGFELIRGTEAHKKAVEKYGDTELALEEALVESIGAKGNNIYNAATRSDFKSWMNAMFKYIKEKFTTFKELKTKEIANLSLENFINISLADLFSGKEVSAEFNPSEVEASARARFDLIDNIDEIISISRSKGFSDASIKEVLKGKGFKIDEINKAMEVNVDLLTPLPREFANVEGGVNEGMKLFNEVRDELNRFSTEGPRGGKGKTRTKTFAEIREKAMSLMQENPIFKRQTEQIQQELLTSFDKTLNTRSNPTVQKQIAAIRNNLKQRKIGANNLKAAQIAVKNFIRSVLPKSDMYSQAQINKLVAAVTDANVDTLRAVAEKVLNIVEQQREKMKDSVIKEMIVLSSKKSKPSMTASGKRRSGGLEEEGQAYFEAIAPVLKAYANNDEEAINKIEKILADTNAIDEVVEKAVNGEDLTTKETALLNTVLAHDMYSNINDMSLEQVQDLLEDMKVARTTSIDKLKMNRLVRAAENKAMSDAATAQIQKSMPILFNEFTDEDGNTTYELKGDRDLNRDRAEVWQAFRDLKVWDGLKKFIKVYDLASLNGLLKQVHDKLVHIETLCNVLDKKGTFFNDNVYRPLNRMEENAIAGQLKEMDRMDDIANSIDGITDGYNEIKKLLAQGIKTIEVNGKTEYLNHNQMLRIYALSKNDVQAEILYSMGYTPSKINEIKGMLGDQVVEFADKVVDYLSNYYYESVNDVYKYVNNVNLGYLNNYFPTRTINEKIQADMLAKGDFNGIFNAETAPALKERTNKVNEIDLAASFTSTLDDHIKSMERYKAYAEGVKKLNSLFSIPAVNTLLEQTAVKRAMKLNVNFAINPDAGLQQNKGISNKLLSKLQGVVLKFKVMQLPKQATSFINGFNEYSYSDKKIPGLDLTMFMVDVADVLRKLPSEIKKFEKISANFRSRVQAAKEGDMRALESGSHEAQPLIDDYSFIGRMKKKFDIAGSAPITYGDIIGVAGYMAAYNRDIKNGMSKADALEKFNNYNATLQTRRPSEKIPLQQSQDIFYRVLTTFGSTAYLQMNKTLIASRNIARTLSEKKMPSKKDLRTFAVSLSVSNALFTTASYMFKYAQGDDEDWEDANKKLMESLLGLNLLYQIPLVGGAMEEMVAAIDGRRLQTDEGFNPYKESMKRINIAMKTEDTGIIVKTALEIATGVSMDPFIGLYKLFADDTTDTWEDIYDIIGVSKSYRPGYGKKGDGGLTKQQMKQYFPEEYQQMYGEEAPYSEAQQEKKQQKQELKEMIDEAMSDEE